MDLRQPVGAGAVSACSGKVPKSPLGVREEVRHEGGSVVDHISAAPSLVQQEVMAVVSSAPSC